MPARMSDCFKNGRGCMPKQPTFADVVNLIVEQASQRMG
jgi:hypothetical protein